MGRKTVSVDIEPRRHPRRPVRSSHRARRVHLDQGRSTNFERGRVQAILKDVERIRRRGWAARRGRRGGAEGWHGGGCCKTPIKRTVTQSFNLIAARTRAHLVQRRVLVLDFVGQVNEHASPFTDRRKEQGRGRYENQKRKRERVEARWTKTLLATFRHIFQNHEVRRFD